MRSQNRYNFRWLAYFSAVVALSMAQNARAQIVYSVGTQEVYDSNIFLEDDKAPANPLKDKDGKTFEQADGKLNSDFISNPYVSLGGKLPFGGKVLTNYNARLGFILYDQNTKQNRVTVDGTVSVSPRQDVLPQYVTLIAADTMSSQASSVGVAQGAATQQGEINVASLSGGLNAYKLSAADAFSNIFTISRQDFLDQFHLSSSNDNEQVKIPGVDSFTYAMNTRLDHTIDTQWSVFVANNINYYDVTGGKAGNSGVEVSSLSNNLDRVNISPSVGGSYAPSTRLQFSASSGVDFTEFANNSSNSPTVDGLKRDSNQSSIFYGGSSSYTVSERASVGINILQSAGTDINGGRLLSRSFGANGNYIFNNQVSGNLSAQLAQFTLGDTLNKATERYSVTASARYSLTEAIAVSAGYSYVVQNSDNQATSILLNDGDYTGHRVFVGLDTGFMGFLK